MAMTIGDANDVQTLVKWATGTQLPAEQVRSAAIRLADHSSRHLMAGVDGDYVAGRWPAPSEAPPADPPAVP